jgi:hypothetical protein
VYTRDDIERATRSGYVIGVLHLGLILLFLIWVTR